MKHLACFAVCGVAVGWILSARSDVIDNPSTSRDANCTTGSILMKNETTPLLMTSETRLRVNTRSAGGTYDLTLPATNFLGALWIYLGAEGVKGDIDMTFDGRGRLFAQYPTVAGEILRNGGADPFVINAFSYNSIVGLAGVPSLESSVESFAFSNTVMKVAAKPDFSFNWSFSGGFVSFAGRSGMVANGGYLLLPNQTRDATFALTFTDADTHLPAVRLRDLYRDIAVTVDGGRCVNNGFLYLNSDMTPTLDGTTLFAISNGAQFVQGDSVTLGQTGFKDLRTDILRLDGPGTTFTHTGGSLNLAGRSVLCVTNGAAYAATGCYQYFLGASASDVPTVIVSGAGSRLDLAGVSSDLRFQGSDVRFAVNEGAELVLPARATFGYDNASVTTLEIAGAGTRVLKAGAGSQVYFPTWGRATVNMTGGTFGPKDGNAFLIRLGHEAGSTGTFNLSGGALDFSASGSSIDIGLSGDATLDVSGGAVTVGGGINLGLLAANTATARSLFRLTGGAVTCFGSVDLCHGADADRRAEVVLDGGTLTCDQLRGSYSSCGGWRGVALVSANGGTLRPCQSRTDARYPYIERIDAFALGARGLTLDTDGFDVVVTQDFANVSGADGLFRKTGAGTLDLRFASYDVARTVVDVGTLKLGAPGAATLATTLCLTNDAALSLVGPATGLTLDGLELAGGTLALDPGDTVTVTGAARIDRLVLALSAAPDAGATNTLFVFRTPLDAASQTALRRAFCTTALADGHHAQFVYEAETGALKMSVERDAEPLGAAETTTWTGADGAAWAADGSWSDGVPTPETRAAFADNGADKSVTVGTGAQVAALGFEGTGFTLTGEGPLSVSGEQGAAEIAAAAGTANAVAVPLAFESAVNLPVATAATLTLAGAIRGGGFRKSGGGTVELAGANAFTMSGATEQGITRVAQAGALDGLVEMSVERDTLAFASDAAVIGTPVVVRAADPATPVVLWAEKDVSLTAFTVAAGGCVKRGAGTLTLDARAATAPWCLTTTLGTGANGRPASSALTGFPSDGAAPAAGVAGFTVAEGEVVLRGGDRRIRHTAPGVIVVGLNATNADARAQATLTLDNAELYNYANKSVHVFVGYGAGQPGAQQVTPTLRLLNGSNLICDTLRVGVDSFASSAGTRATLALTNATVRAGSIYFSDSTTPQAPTVVRCKDSELTSGAYPIYVHGVVDAVFDNCWIGYGNQARRLTDRPTQFGLYNWNYHIPTGQVAFVNGTTLHATLLNFAGLQKGMTLLFDDAEWNYGNDADYTFAASAASDALTMRLCGKGLVLRPAAGTTFTTEVPLVGDGGVCNLGAGTVKFAEGSYGFTGTCRTGANATVDLTDAGTLAAVRVGGAGTFKGVSAQKTTLAVTVTDDWTVADVPTFDGGSLGAVTVDLGRTDETALPDDLPQSLLVARLTGGAKAASFRLRGRSTGLSRVAGRFTVDESGEVRLTVFHSGLLMIVR